MNTIGGICQAAPIGLLVATMLCGGAMCPCARADLHETFESVTPAWEVGKQDCQWVMYDHRRVFGDAHRGQGTEYFSFASGQGTHAHLKFSVLPTRVIDELQIGVWVRGSRRGTQLLVRVVLPRTKDPRTKKPMTTWLYGPTYERVGEWQSLRLEKPASKLEAVVFTLRSEFGPSVDPAEAYIDQVVLNTYSGPGATQLWVDDLEIQGQVLRVDPIAPSVARRRQLEPDRAGAVSLRRVSWRGNMLYIEGRPTALRVVDHRNESLAFLKSLGFNAVALDHTPTPEENRAAAESDLWLLAPLPLDTTKLDPGPRLLAWIWPVPLTDRDLEIVRTRMTAYRQAHTGIPVIGFVRSSASAYSHLLDAVVLERPVLGSTTPLESYLAWLRQVTSSLRMDAPVWVGINSELPWSVEQQLAAMGGREESWLFSTDALHTIALRVVQQRVRTIWFRSRHSLQARDAVIQRRADALRRINQDLTLLGPWLAAGDVVSSGLSTSPQLKTVLWRTDQARMLAAVREGAGVACVPGARGSTPIAVAVDEMPATDEAYLVQSTGLSRLATRRGAGLRLLVSSPRNATFALLTNDAHAVRYIAEHLQQERNLALQRLRDRVRQEIEWTSLTMERLKPWIRRTTPADGNGLEEIRRRYAYLERLSRSQEERRAADVGEEILDELRRLQRSQWELALSGLDHPATSPASLTFFSLPLHWQFASRRWQAAWPGSLLPAGRFESLAQLRDAGWKYDAALDPRLHPRVTITHNEIRSGRGALRLECRSPAAAALLAGTPSIAIRSPLVPIQAGQLVKFSGWVKTDTPLHGSPDGLRISESLGGEALALTLHNTEDKWRPIVLYRIAPTTTNVHFTIELFGYGSVSLDDFSIQVLPAGS